MTPKFVIRKSKNGQFYFNFHAGNGEITATGETYTTKQSCYNGIEVLQQHAAGADIIDQTYKTDEV